MIEGELQSIILHDELPEGYEGIRIERGDQVGLFDKLMDCIGQAYILYLLRCHSSEICKVETPSVMFIENFLPRLDSVSAIEILIRDRKYKGDESRASVYAIKFIGSNGYEKGFERVDSSENYRLITFESVGMTSKFHETFHPQGNPNNRFYIRILNVVTGFFRGDYAFQ